MHDWPETCYKIVLRLLPANTAPEQKCNESLAQDGQIRVTQGERDRITYQNIEESSRGDLWDTFVPALVHLDRIPFLLKHDNQIQTRFPNGFTGTEIVH